MKVWLCKHNYFGLSVLFLLLFAASCNRQPKSKTVDRAFYFWKSKFSLSEAETDVLKQLRVQKLYLKLFDVGFDNEKKQVAPLARVQVDTAALQTIRRLGITVLPVVFITNESLLISDSAAASNLANKIVTLTSIIQQKDQLPVFKELQLDCDWTGSTKEKYFQLLRQTAELMKSNKESFTVDAKLSATIRLHQVKYKGKTGVPPVGKGLLMCYNMGSLKNPAVKNSILDVDEMQQYLGSLKDYPLPLDIALPLFEWNVYFRNNIYKGIVSSFDPQQYAAAGNLSNNIFRFHKDTIIQNIAFTIGDQLRFETSAPAEINKAIIYLQKRLPEKNTHFTVSFYHLDELILNKHPQYELENFYNGFR